MKIWEHLAIELYTHLAHILNMLQVAFCSWGRGSWKCSTELDEENLNSPILPSIIALSAMEQKIGYLGVWVFARQHV